MADLNRPDYGQVWASTGEKVAPDTVKMQSGWVQEMMPFQYENYLQARQDEAIVYLLQKGVPEYSPTQEYVANKSVVVYQGNLYMATATVTNVLPTVTASWKRLNVPLAANGAVPVSSGGTGATTASEARTNLGLGGIATSTAPATNGIVVKDANDSLVARTITGTSGNITITNPDGVAGNINVNVGSNVAQLSQDSSWTSKGGIRLPSGSTGERGTEVAGKIRYNTTLQKFEGFDGTSWNALGASSNIEITTLSGNGVTTNFTLNSDVFSAVATDVYIGGIYQSKASYSVSGSTLTFSEAPVAGVDNIQVLSRRVVDLGLSTATQVSIQDTTNLYTSSTVEGALREVGEKAKYVKNAILSFPDYASASAAAATLPDGQEIEAPTSAGRLSRFSVQSGALVFKDFAPDAIRMQSYAALSAYTGKSEAIDITTPGISGRWNCRGVVPGAASNGGTMLIDALGRLWERDFFGPWRFEWFGAKGDKVTDDSDIISSVLNQAKGAVVITAGKGFRITKRITVENNELTGILGEDMNSSGLIFTDFGKLEIFSTLAELPALAGGSVVSGASSVTLASAPTVPIENGDVLMLWNPVEGSFLSARPDYHDGCMNQIHKLSGAAVHVYGKLSDMNESSLRVFLLKKSPLELKNFYFKTNDVYPNIHVKHRVGISCNIAGLDAGNYLGVDFDKCFDITIEAPRMSGNTGNAYPFHLVNSQNVRIFGGSNRSIRHATGIGGNNEVGSVPPRDITIFGMHLYNNTADAPADVGSADVHGGSENVKYIGCVLHNGCGVNGKNIKYSDCDIYSYQRGGGYIGSGTEQAGGELSFSNCRFHVKRSMIDGSGAIISLGLNYLVKDLTVILKNIHLVFDDSTGNTVFPLLRLTPNITSAKIKLVIDGITTEGASPKYGALVNLPTASGVSTHNENVKVEIRGIDEARYASYAPTTGESPYTKFRIDGYSLRATTALVSGTDTSQVTVTHPITFPKLPSVNVSAYDNPGSSGYWLPLGRATSTTVIVYSKKLEAGNVFTGNMNLQIDASLKEF